jgi:hypothetical protein
MSGGFFYKLYSDGPNRYCKGYKSQVARDLLKIGTKFGEEPKGLCFGLSAKFVNALEEIPTSTKKCIIVPWMAKEGFNYETTTYDKTTFDADVVDYKISQEEFDAVVHDLKLNDYWVPQRTLKLGLAIAIYIISMLFVCISMVVFGQGYGAAHPAVYWSVILLCPILALLGLTSPLILYRTNESRLSSRQEAFAKILENWNHKVFNDRKVKWKIGKFGCWLEIHFDQEISQLESFNREVKEQIIEELQQEYVNEAKRLNINVDGQRVEIGSIGCENKEGTTRGSPDYNDIEVGYAIPADEPVADNDDLEIKNVYMAQPLVKNAG